MQNLIDVFFNLDVIKSVFPLLMKGLALTAVLSACTIALGTGFGLLVALAITQRHSKFLTFCAIAYVDIFRALPPLVLLIFASFLINFWGFHPPTWAIIGLCFTLSTACYYGEIFRAGIQAIPIGQSEAAWSTGLSRSKTMTLIVLPQVFRNSNAEICSNSLQVIKMTTIASVLGTQELLSVARDAQSFTYSPAPLMAAALIFMVILWPAVRWVSNLSERKKVSQ